MAKQQLPAKSSMRNEITHPHPLSKIIIIVNNNNNKLDGPALILPVTPSRAR